MIKLKYYMKKINLIDWFEFGLSLCRRMPIINNLRVRRLLGDILDGWRVKFNVKHIYGAKDIKFGLDGVIVLCLVRNAEYYIEVFIKYYFSLGAKHIVFLDNGSTDRTIDLAKKYGNVTILRSNLFFQKYQCKLRQYLMNRFARNQWSLNVDMDEFFDYPHSDKMDITSLVKYLRVNKYNAVVANMLDLFSDKTIYFKQKFGNLDLSKFKNYYFEHERSRLYRLEESNVVSNDAIKEFIGAIPGQFNYIAPCIKHPLIFNDGKIKPIFEVHFVKSARLADFSTVLYHYQFVDNLFNKWRDASFEKNYGDNSEKYSLYYSFLKDKKFLKINVPNSKELNDVNQLIKEGYIVVSDKFCSFVNASGKG